MAGEKPSKEALAEKLDRELDDHIDAVLEKNKDYKYEGGFTEENYEEEMRRIPLFSREQPTQEDIDNSEEWQALQALKYECEDPHACALAHKDDGNHNFQKKEYKYAIIAYTEAIKQNHEDTVLYAVLYTNRAAANFHLGNNRSALNDAARALTYKPDHMKAFIRCATCCFDLEKYDDCVTWCDKGLQIDEKEKKLLELKKKSAFQKKQQERDNRKTEMRQMKDLTKRNNLLVTIESRKINIDQSSGSVAKKSNIERLLLDSSSPHSGKIYLDENRALHWPLYFLYPEYNQSDFIEDFLEDHCFQDHLNIVFEIFPEWDVQQNYAIQNLLIYFEDKTRKKLIHVNPYIPLRKVLSDRRYIMRGGCPAFMIFSKISEFYKQYSAVHDAEEFEVL